MRSKFHRLGLWLVILVFSLAVVLFPGCAPKVAPPTTPTAIPLEPIRISINSCETGAAGGSIAGQIVLFDLLVKMVNRAGGLKGGHPLQGFVYDNQSKIDLAVAGAKKAIFEDKVSVIIMATVASMAKAMEPITTENRVLLFSISGGFEPTTRYSFKTTGRDIDCLQVTLEWLKKQVGSVKLGYLASTDSTGELGVAAISKVAPANTVPLMVERFNLSDVDVKTQLTKLRGGGINAIVIHTTGAQAAMAARNALELGYKMPIVLSWGNVSQPFADLCKDLTVDNLYLFGPVGTGSEGLPANHPIGVAVRWVSTTYEKELGRPYQFGVQNLTFDVFMVLASALDAVGADPEALVNYLETNVKVWAGVNSFYTFTPTDRFGGTGDGIGILRLKGGKFTLMPDSVLPIPSGYKTIPMLEKLMKIK